MVRLGDFPEKWDEKVFNLSFQLTYKERAWPEVEKVGQPSGTRAWSRRSTLKTRLDVGFYYGL